MSKYEVAVSKVIPAPADKVYPVFADYIESHPAILPKEFTGLTVSEGGYGAGTVMEVGMKVFGVKVVLNLTATEPEPGRILAEEDKEAGVYTTFSVEPINGGEQSHVTIATQFRASPGIKGAVEKLINRPVTRRIYNDELDNVAAYVQRA